CRTDFLTIEWGCEAAGAAPASRQPRLAPRISDTQEPGFRSVAVRASRAAAGGYRAGAVNTLWRGGSTAARPRRKSPLPRGEPVSGPGMGVSVDLLETIHRGVGVDASGGQAGVTEELLYGHEIRARVDEVGREAVSKRVGG